MKGWEPWCVRTRRCSDVRNYGRTVVDHVTTEERMRGREVVVDPHYAVVLVRGALIGGDQVPGSVPVIGSIRRRNQVEELLYARINCDSNTSVRSGVAAARWASGRG